jgi:hypothetical protein
MQNLQSHQMYQKSESCFNLHAHSSYPEKPVTFSRESDRRKLPDKITWMGGLYICYIVLFQNIR